MKRVAAKVVNVLRSRNVIVAAAGGVAVLQARVACQGYSKLKGTLQIQAGGTPTTGFPRVTQFQDQSTATGPSLITVLSRDTSQPNESYPIDIDLSCPYCAVEYTEDPAGAGCTILVAQAELRGS